VKESFNGAFCYSPIILKEKYTDGDGHLQEVLDNAQETPESNNLLKKFVDRVLLANDG